MTKAEFHEAVFKYAHDVIIAVALCSASFIVGMYWDQLRVVWCP